MATIDASYFFGDLLVAQKSEQSVANSLGWFIDEYEPRLLTDLFGYELYKNYNAGLAADPPAQKWLDIRDGKEYTNRCGIVSKWKGLKFLDGSAKKSPIANFVYYHWLKDKASDTTASGEKTTANQNSIDASPGIKMVRAWNQMVEWNCELVEFLLSNQDVYPEFLSFHGRPCPNYLLYKTNVMGI
jgi:hypothetical protein